MSSPLMTPSEPRSTLAPSAPHAIRSRPAGEALLPLPLPPPSPPPPPPPPTRDPRVDKWSVVARPQRLTAVRLLTDQQVQLVDGRTRTAQAGEWLITDGMRVVDLVGDLDRQYVIEDSGQCVLPSSLCAQLEHTTGVGSTRSPVHLVAAVERLAAIHIGTIQIDFTPGQLEQVQYRARKRGQTIAQALQAVVDRIREEIFWNT